MSYRELMQIPGRSLTWIEAGIVLENKQMVRAGVNRVVNRPTPGHKPRPLMAQADQAASRPCPPSTRSWTFTPVRTRRRLIAAQTPLIQKELVMTFTSLSLVTAAGLAAMLSAPIAFAGAGHDHGPKYGGVVRALHNLSYELVAKPDSLTLYVSDHGKPVPTRGATAEAVIYAGSGKTTVKLEPAGDNRMQAKGDFKVGVGVRVMLTTTLPGKTPAKAAFNLK